MRALLDVNVIIALLDSGHVMHHSACTWLQSGTQPTSNVLVFRRGRGALETR
jgi:predicted nucleic acid-binding protein